MWGGQNGLLPANQKAPQKEQNLPSPLPSFHRYSEKAAHPRAAQKVEPQRHLQANCRNAPSGLQVTRGSKQIH